MIKLHSSLRTRLFGALLASAACVSGFLGLWAHADGQSDSSAGSKDQQAYFSSGEQKVSLIELYTSEGCSSCPPADKWLSGLAEGEALWKNVVPVAFHVSYWDRLGWPDRFAQREFDTRQRQLAARAEAGVYTPGMFRDGQEFRTWRRNSTKDLDRAFEAASSRSQPVGNLELAQKSDGAWQLRYEPAQNSQQPTNAYVAVLGNDLVNDIGRGENAGRRLEHDFVVLDLASNSLSADDKAFVATFDIDTSITGKPALAAWVTDSRGNPIQALGGVL